MSNKQSLTLAATLSLAVYAPCAGAATADGKPPQVIALVATVGDQLSMVRQVPSTGSNIEPFRRRVLPLQGQAINLAVLRGLDRGIAEDEPQARRVLLRWTPPADTARSLEEARGDDRNDLILNALIEHLRALPERAQWDRIEAILPKQYRREARGMGSKLSGVGIYVQPLRSNKYVLSEDGLDMLNSENEGDNRTIDPQTGNHGSATTYVAPYIYFERITLDAPSLQILRRQRQFDSVKYHDPNSTAVDVGDQMPLLDVLGRLLELAERSAYQSVRGKDSSVEVSPPKVLPAAAASAAAR